MGLDGDRAKRNGEKQVRQIELPLQGFNASR
jgi:hypothetical protein